MHLTPVVLLITALVPAVQGGLLPRAASAASSKLSVWSSIIGAAKTEVGSLCQSLIPKTTSLTTTYTTVASPTTVIVSTTTTAYATATSTSTVTTEYDTTSTYTTYTTTTSTVTNTPTVTPTLFARRKRSTIENNIIDIAFKALDAIDPSFVLSECETFIKPATTISTVKATTTTPSVTTSTSTATTTSTSTTVVTTTSTVTSSFSTSATATNTATVTVQAAYPVCSGSSSMGSASNVFAIVDDADGTPSANTVFLNEIDNLNYIQCAQACVATSGCNLVFQYNDPTPQCYLYQSTPTGTYTEQGSEFGFDGLNCAAIVGAYGSSASNCCNLYL